MFVTFQPIGIKGREEGTANRGKRGKVESNLLLSFVPRNRKSKLRLKKGRTKKGVGGVEENKEDRLTAERGKKEMCVG